MFLSCVLFMNKAPLQPWFLPSPLFNLCLLLFHFTFILFMGIYQSFDTANQRISDHGEFFLRFH